MLHVRRMVIWSTLALLALVSLCLILAFTVWLSLSTEPLSQIEIQHHIVATRVGTVALFPATSGALVLCGALIAGYIVLRHATKKPTTSLVTCFLAGLAVSAAGAAVGITPMAVF